jgi:hypothetical protein
MADPSSSAGKSERNKPDDAALSDSQYLRREVARAKAAMARAWDDAKAKAVHGVDPRTWTCAHPWYALTGATVAGFLAAYALTPTKQEQALKQLAELNKALAGVAPGEEPPVVEAVVEGDSGQVYRAGFVAPGAGGGGHTGRIAGILGTLGMTALRTVAPSIISAVTAAITAKATDDDATNGHAPAVDDAPPPGAVDDYSSPT